MFFLSFSLEQMVELQYKTNFETTMHYIGRKHIQFFVLGSAAM